MNQVHLSMLRGLASQAGIIMATISSMSSILPAYYTSYDNILSVFLNFVEQTGRYNMYCYVATLHVEYKWHHKMFASALHLHVVLEHTTSSA